MLITIDNILDWPKVKQVREAMAGAEFVDGQRTAGFRAKRVKHNEQLSATAEVRKEIDALVIGSLRRNDHFQRFALPRSLKRPCSAATVSA